MTARLPVPLRARARLVRLVANGGLCVCVVCFAGADPPGKQKAWAAFAMAVAAADGEKLLSPGAKNQPVVDAVDGPRRGFQHTLNAKHKGPPKEKLDTLLDVCGVKAGGEPFRIFYVVPAVLVDCFVAPQCDDARVELWVMRLPLADAVKPKSYQPRSQANEVLSQ